MDVGQPIIAALGAVGQLPVIRAYDTQDSGVQSVDVDRVLGGLIAVLVGSAVAVTAAHAPADEGAGEAVVVVGAAARGQALPG